MYRHSQANINMAKLNTQSGVSKATGKKVEKNFQHRAVQSYEESVVSCHEASCWLENRARRFFSFSPSPRGTRSNVEFFFRPPKIYFERKSYYYIVLVAMLMFFFLVT